MITPEQYFAGKPHTPEHKGSAITLLYRVNALRDRAESEGVVRHTCPNTGTEISGSKGGSGDGGFRLETSTTGSGRSSHKEAKGVDAYDPGNRLDGWVTDAILEEFDLYREAPESTDGWCHLTTRRPGSGRRTFSP